ncbi:MAG: acyltransferase [Clostridia bacterium]|nr:acyltransferase [Clostridia bacterium]
MKSKDATSTKSIQRESGLELFRIITMLLIVAHHYVVNSGLWGENGPIMNTPMAGQSLFLLFFGAWGKTGINCFVLITGYFMCKSRITVKKFLKFLLEIEFYKILFYVIFTVTGYAEFSVSGFAKTILPVTQVKSNFTGCYLLFFLCIPFLNILIKSMTEKQHIYITTLLCFIYVLLGTAFGKNINMNYVSWFAVLYFIASYIRLYPKKIFKNRKFWGITALLMIAFSMASVIFFTWLGKPRFDPYYLLQDSNKLLAVLTALSAFMFFKNLKFNSAFVNTIAASCFGVLLIHANSDTMRKWLWYDVLDNAGMFNSQWLIVHMVTSVIVIYIVCTIIDYLRIKFLEKPFFRFADKYIDKIAQTYKKTEQKICKRLQITED